LKELAESFRIIEALLKTLESSNFTASPAECEWGFPNVLFLGFQIGVDGLMMDPKTTKIIAKLAPPTNRKGLQRLLGLFVYWRRFIKQSSSHIYHVRDLLKEDQQFRWNSDCDAELNYLKSCLTSSPILATIYPNKDFFTMCYAAGSSGCG